MLELRDVSRAAQKDPLLSHISFDCAPGTPTSVLGLTEVGRAGLLGLLGGADRPQTGTIRLGGRDVMDARKARSIVRISPFGVKPSGRPVAKVIGAEAAGRAGLTNRLSALVKDLDLEGRIRLGIAAALEADPALILLDAPATELGGEARGRLCADLHGMLSGGSSVVVMASGAADEAVGLGGQVVVLARGRLVQAGMAADVFAYPANLAAAVATSWPALNAVAMVVRDGVGVLGDGATFAPPAGVALPAEGAVTLAFRPEDATLARAGENCVRFVVRAAGEEAIGGRAYTRVVFAGASWLAPKMATAPHAGAVLNAFVDRAHLMVFDADGNALA